MEPFETAIVTFCSICLLFGAIYLTARYFFGRKFQKFMEKINSVPLESLPDLASTYETYLKEKYKIALKDMPYREHVEYVATHFKTLDRGYKKYFPQGRDWLTIAAAADLGELIRTTCRADWSRPETGSAIPFLEITLPDGEKIACEIFAVFLLQAPYDDDMRLIQRECLETLNAKKAGIRWDTGDGGCCEPDKKG